MKKSTCKKHIWILLIIIPLVLGLIIYCNIGRAPTLLYRLGICNFSGIEPKNDALRFLRFYGTDILWACSLSTAVMFIYKDAHVNMRNLVLLVCLFEIMIETLQYTGWIKGTFDIWDIIFECTFSYLTVKIITKIQIKRRDVNNE